jgi:hypothetical protein
MSSQTWRNLAEYSPMATDVPSSLPETQHSQKSISYPQRKNSCRSLGLFCSLQRNDAVFTELTGRSAISVLPSGTRPRLCDLGYDKVACDRIELTMCDHILALRGVNLADTRSVFMLFPNFPQSSNGTPMKSTVYPLPFLMFALARSSKIEQPQLSHSHQLKSAKVIRKLVRS